MPENTISKLETKIGLATQGQLALATQLGVTLGPAVPALVAAEILRALLRDELLTPPERIPSPDQLEYLSDLTRSAHLDDLSDFSSVLDLAKWADVPDGHRALPHIVDTRSLASAWIQLLLARRTVRALRSLQLCEGDLVGVSSSYGEATEFVSSVSETGRVNFLGGRGRASWPHKLRLIARADETGPELDELRRITRNRSALSSTTGDFSMTKMTALRSHHVENTPSSENIDELGVILEVAIDERPLQAFLTLHPELITSVLTGTHARFAIPEVALGNQFRPDFMIADVNSLGLRWVLVELESPTAHVTLQKAEEFAEKARHAIGQVKSWREWLLHNIDYARRPAKERGLGLFDVRPETRALVLVGRRRELRANSYALRMRLEETEDIIMHTYGWLLDVLADRSPGMRPNLGEVEPWDDEPF